jgi:hypothetical protein
MQILSKSYKFIGKILPDGHLSVPDKVAKGKCKEFEVTMKPVDDINRSLSLYINKKNKKKGKIKDLLLPSDRIASAVKAVFGTSDVDTIIDSIRR